MPIDPTTLHGRTLGSLTVEELEACPIGTTFGEDTAVRVPGGWLRHDPISSIEVKDTYVDDCAVELPDTPTPDQFREMHQLLGGKTDPARIHRPNERPPVYAIGRFVVVTLVSGATRAFVASDVVGADCVDGSVSVYVRDDERIDIAPGVTMDPLLYAIAKAEGR